ERMAARCDCTSPEIGDAVGRCWPLVGVCDRRAVLQTSPCCPGCALSGDAGCPRTRSGGLASSRDGRLTSSCPSRSAQTEGLTVCSYAYLALVRQRIPLLLKDKALASMRRMVRAFNELDDDGRQTTVMLHLQHAFEMLLKAAL